jgi:ketol-acid reductoisomerase
VAILGFGHQGEAHALNLRANGVSVIVGARPHRPGEGRARALGFSTFSPTEAAERATVAAVLLPDEVLPLIWGELSPAFRPGTRLVFAHGFNLLYESLRFPPESDVVLVAPTGPGSVLKRLAERGERMAAYLAVHQQGSGSAWEFAEVYAERLGCCPLWRTTIREETEVDLFGEQVVLCGGMNALVLAAFELLVQRGYPSEMAYLECAHQLKYLADLLHERGVAGFRQAISGTALYGDLSRGPRVVGEACRREMAAILDEIQSGTFAREWKTEVAGGRKWLLNAVETAAEHPIEEARRRALEAGEDRRGLG